MIFNIDFTLSQGIVLSVDAEALLEVLVKVAPGYMFKKLYNKE